MSGENPNLKAALSYVEQGWPVIPLYHWTPRGCACNAEASCHTPAKHPVLTGWRSPDYQATTAEEVDHVWGDIGNAYFNVGIVTGEPSGVFVLDVDPDSGGNDSLTRLCEDYGEFPYTRIHRTGSGGKHYFFKMPDNQDISNSHKNLRRAGYTGLDIRGTGGYVVAPPSVTNKGDYRVSTQATVAEAPPWLLDLLLLPDNAKSNVVDRDKAGDYSRYPQALRSAIDTYCTRAVEAELARFETEHEFGEWDNLTNEVSFSLFILANSPWNNLDMGDIEAQIEEHANTDEGFPFSRVRKCVNSAYNSVEAKDLVRDIPEQIAKEARQLEAPRQVNSNTFIKGDRKATLVSAADIKMQRTKWVWKDRIAQGTLSLLAGEPGLGKSTLVYWIVGQLTTGKLFGEFEGTPKDVIICATEDSWSHTIVPRLVAAGADRSRVFRVDITEQSGTMSGLNLMTDQDLLESIVEQRDVGLLVLDPLMSRLGDRDTHKDSDVRQALEPMCAIADRCKFAIIGLMHHNKSGSTNPLRSVMGSTAFSAVARSVHTVIAAPEDDDYDGPSQRLFGTIKNNLGKVSGEGSHDLDTWAFHIDTVSFNTEDDDPDNLTIGKLVWDGDAKMTIGAGMAEAARREKGGEAKKGPESDKGNRSKAEDFLVKLFQRHGRMTREEVLRIGTQNINGGHNERTLDHVIKRDTFEIIRESDARTGQVTAYWNLAYDQGK